MDKKITLYTGQKKLFDKLSDEKLALIFRNVFKELDSQEIEPISDPAADMLYTMLSAEIVPVDGRSISSKINGKKHKKRAKHDLASETQKTEAISENFDFSLNYKIKNKEVNINKGNNTQEDISTEDNIPYIKSPKKERNINISSQKRVLLSASDEKKPSKEEIDFSKLMLYFNEKMKGQTIRPITTMTDVRKRAVLARLRKHGKDSIQNVIDKAAASDWLNGNNNRNWVADFNWIFQENRFVDILEGKYDNSVKKTSAKSGYVDQMIADGTRLRQDQMDYTKNIW